MLATLRRRCLDPIVALLTQGTTPEKIALSIAVGGVVGVFPVLGTTTVLCTLAAALLRLNLLAVQTVHFAVTPAQLLLIIPFVRVGEHAIGSDRQPLSIGDGLALIADGALRAVTVLWDAILHALLGWLLVGPLTLAVLYVVLRPILTRAAARLRGAAPATHASAGPRALPTSDP
jgi:uncharacterized protein (DUF2062 family)